MENIVVGAHIPFSSKDGVFKTLKCQPDAYDCFQIYIGNPRSFGGSELKSKDLLKVRRKYKDKLFVHASLVYNLCGSKEGESCPKYARNLEFTRKGLIRDLDECALMGCGLVVHIGAAKDRDWGIAKVVETIEYVLSKDSAVTEKYSGLLGRDIKKERLLLLENSAGEGTKLGRDIPELAKIYNMLKMGKENVKFCVDSCHGFAAESMDFGSVDGINKFWEEWEEKIGKDKIMLFHLNDSKGEFGCKKDRHEVLTFGKIWEGKVDVLKHFLLSAKSRRIPLILERKEDTTEKEALLCKSLVQ